MHCIKIFLEFPSGSRPSQTVLLMVNHIVSFIFSVLYAHFRMFQAVTTLMCNICNLSGIGCLLFCFGSGCLTLCFKTEVELKVKPTTD